MDEGLRKRVMDAVKAAPGSTAAEIAADCGQRRRHVVAMLLPELEQAGGCVERGVPRVCAITRLRAVTWHRVTRQ